MRIGRLYPVAVALVVGGGLGAVAVGWDTLGATEDNPNGARELRSAHTGGGGAKQTPQGKQTPLLMRVLDPPQPVKGTDGKYHLVYELVLTNSSPGTAKVESIQTMDAKSGEVVDSLAGANVAARTVLLGDISGQTADKIGSGRVALVFLDA